MLRKEVNNIMAAIIAAGLVGCTQQATRLDQNWGRSYETSKYNQTLNMEAEKNLEPVIGLEGPSAERIMKGHISGGDCSKQKPSTEFGILTIKQ